MGKRLRQLQAQRAQEHPHYRRVVEVTSAPVEAGPRLAARCVTRVVAEQGTPLVVNEQFGLTMPLDDEDAIRAERIYRRDDWTRDDGSGRVIAVNRVVSRLRQRPGPPCGSTPEVSRMPSRAVMMAASGGLRIVLDDLRRACIGHDRESRPPRPRGPAGPGESALHGPDETFLCTGLPTPAMSSPPDSSSCAGASTTSVTPFQSARVAAINAYAYLDDGYDGAGQEGLAAWAVGDEVVASGPGWVATASVPHVVVTVIENSAGSFPDPTHPAFLSALGDSRARFFIQNDGTVLSVSVPPSGYTAINLGALTSGGSHGTATAGVALASVVDGQDARVADEGDREGRSGVARRAYAVFSADASVNTFDVLQGYSIAYAVLVDGQVISVDSEHLAGTDIVVQSQGSNTGSKKYGPSHDLTTCPTDAEARGLDEESLRVLEAYLDDSAIYVKSAGNGHDPTGAGSAATKCLPIPGDEKSPVPFEVSSPGTSAAAIAVGSLQTGGINSGNSPAAMQRMESLNQYTEGCVTPDGRVYPSLVASHFSCGVAGSWTASDGSVVQGYVKHGLTSAAAPTVAGAAAVFKHWYLDAHGADTANQPGRMMSNILNMADGVAFDAWSGGERAYPPAPGWGLGRFRMRRYAGGHMSRHWLRATSAVTLTDEDPVDVVWIAGDESDAVPDGTKRLVITLWWLEVNTGGGEEKADIGVSLYAMDEAAGWRLVDARDAAGDCKVRLQYDCYDAYFDAPPTGRVVLVVQARTVPRESRGAGRSARTVYVSWYWEGGPDLSLVEETATACRDSGLDLCDFHPVVDGGPAVAKKLAACTRVATPRAPCSVPRDRTARLCDDLEGLLRGPDAPDWASP